jgi:hypothetical protein
MARSLADVAAMKVLALTRYAALGASSRLRFLQYLPALSAAGIEVEARHLLDDGYLRRLHAGQGRSTAALLRAYAVRLADLLGAARSDLRWVEKELFPGLPATLTGRRRTSSSAGSARLPPCVIWTPCASRSRRCGGSANSACS